MLTEQISSKTFIQASGLSKNAVTKGVSWRMTPRQIFKNELMSMSVTVWQYHSTTQPWVCYQQK